MKELNDFRCNIYSQNGEDGVIREILNRLNIQNDGWVVEFGACDGKYLSNTFNLVENNNFKAIYIESYPEFFKQLELTSELFKNIYPINTYITPTSLTPLLEKTLVPIDFDILSIDVDGIDYHIWCNFEKYNPKLVIIEINSSFTPDIELIHSDSNLVTGTSFLSMLKLGIQKGYTLICHTGNMFFLRNDLVSKINLSEEYINNPEKLFIYDWIKK